MGVSGAVVLVAAQQGVPEGVERERITRSGEDEAVTGPSQERPPGEDCCFHVVMGGRGYGRPRLWAAEVEVLVVGRGAVPSYQP